MCGTTKTNRAGSIVRIGFHNNALTGFPPLPWSQRETGGEREEDGGRESERGRERRTGRRRQTRNREEWRCRQSERGVRVISKDVQTGRDQGKDKRERRGKKYIY